MMSFVMTFARPNCVDDDEWLALATLHGRLERALRDDDPELMVGTAKELCESVAKITHQQRNQQFAPLADVPELIAGAHRLVDRLPAVGGAKGSAVRNLAQTAMTLAKQLNELRNQAGTGHGKPTPTGLDDIDGRFAASTALLWSSWVLSRLDTLVANDPDRLAADISSHIYYAGDVARRLTEAGLPTMEARDQFAVGFAVGQRGGPGGTVNVYREGVLAARSTPDLSAWPSEYRRGVAHGLVTDRNAYTVVSSDVIDAILELVAPLPERGASVVSEIRELVAGSQLAYSVTGEGRAQAVVAIRNAALTMAPPMAKALEALAVELSDDE